MKITRTGTIIIIINLYEYYAYVCTLNDNRVINMKFVYLNAYRTRVQSNSLIVLFCRSLSVLETVRFD